jgi:hypothetical protein
MPRVRGISEKVRYAHNPLPVCTEAELFERVGLDLIVPSEEQPPFRIMWKYGGGLESENLTLDPGDFWALRESEVIEFEREWAELGMVVVDDYTDKEEVRAASAKGLARAQTFYHDRGQKRLTEMRKIHGYSLEDMKDHMSDHWSYYLNKAKAEVIMEALKALREPKKAIAKGERANS